jgi:hypothetical protein
MRVNEGVVARHVEDIGFMWARRRAVLQTRHAAFRACSLAGGSSLDPWVGQNLANPSSPVARALLLDLAADRGIVVDSLAGSLRSSDPPELVAALRMAWRAPWWSDVTIAASRTR